MILRIFSGILFLITFYFGLTHGFRSFQKPSQQYLQMMIALGINDTLRIVMGAISIISALLILLPQTFFTGNLIRAMLLLQMMALALKIGNYRFALIEIPFLIMPMILIYLGYPFTSKTL